MTATMKTMKTSKQTANEAYTERFDAITAQLATIERKMEAHAASAAAQRTHWGHAGDLGHVHAQIAEIIRFLGSGS